MRGRLVGGPYDGDAGPLIRAVSELWAFGCRAASRCRWAVHWDSTAKGARANPHYGGRPEAHYRFDHMEGSTAVYVYGEMPGGDPTTTTDAERPSPAERELVPA